MNGSFDYELLLMRNVTRKGNKTPKGKMALHFKKTVFLSYKKNYHKRTPYIVFFLKITIMLPSLIRMFPLSI